MNQYFDPNIPQTPTLDLTSSSNSRTRRQYQSCDQCRRSHRACDAVALGINPLVRNASPTGGPKIACSACQKYRKTCTFKWLQVVSPSNLPESLKRRLNTSNDPVVNQRRTMPYRDHQELGESSRTHTVNDHVTISSASSNTTWQSNSGTGDSGSTINKKMSSAPEHFSWHSGNINPPSFDSGVQNQDVYSLPPSIASTYPPPLATGVLGGMNMFLDFNASFGPFTQNSSTRTATESTEADEMLRESFVSSDFTKDDSNSEFASRGRNFSISDSSNWSVVHTENVEESSGWLNTHSSKITLIPPNKPELDERGEEIANATTKSIIATGMVKVFKEMYEDTISCFLATQIFTFKMNGQSRLKTSLGGRTMYAVVGHLDNQFQSLRTQPLTPTDIRQAIKVLNLSILAFASQWGCQSLPEQQEHPSTSFARLMHRSLWHSARQALQKTSHLDSFRVILAKMTFVVLPEPVDDEDIPSEIEGVSDSDHQQQSHEGQLQLVVPQEDPGLSKWFLELTSAFRSLTAWKQRLYQNHLVASDNFTIVLNPEFHGKGRTWEKDIEDFFLLFWLGIQYDTVTASLKGKPMSIIDEDILSSGSEESRLTLIKYPGMGFENFWKLAADAASQLPSANLSMLWLRDTGMSLKVLQLLIPTNQLLWRMLSVMQTHLKEKTSHQKVEETINNTIQVVNHWRTHFAGLVQSYVINQSALPFDTVIRYCFINAHCRLACLYIACCIEDLDAAFKSDKRQQLWRTSTCFIPEMKRQDMFAVAELARISFENVTFQSGRQDLGSDRGALFGEPWPVFLELSLTKSCETFIDWIYRSYHPNHENSLYLWIRANTDVDNLIMQTKSCIKGLRIVGWKSKTSAASAVRLQVRLKQVMSERPGSELP